ncbi:hypothetical protein S1OALGB6SA_156 [Olavius algarvensis spirochete endosymbiont]|nr:hypothetical protein S1OALGB6SA_156 [Olavius algarvensis spirochete endosymbiont]
MATQYAPLGPPSEYGAQKRFATQTNHATSNSEVVSATFCVPSGYAD